MESCISDTRGLPPLKLSFVLFFFKANFVFILSRLGENSVKCLLCKRGELSSAPITQVQRAKHNDVYHSGIYNASPREAEAGSIAYWMSSRLVRNPGSNKK